MSESFSWRGPLRPQRIPLKRPYNSDEDLPTRHLKVTGAEFLGSGTSGEVSAVEAALERRPRFLQNPIGWFFPQERELKGLAIKIMRPNAIGDAEDAYKRCKKAGLTVPRLFRALTLRDGRDAILMNDLRENDYVVAQRGNIQSEESRPKGMMTEITNFDMLLQDLFREVISASTHESHGLVLGGDSLFFLMPQHGGAGNIKHIFADFDRLYDQRKNHSFVLQPLEQAGNLEGYKKEVTKINLDTIEKRFKELVVYFVVQEKQDDYISRISTHVAKLKEKYT